MRTSILVAVGLCVSGLALTWIGYELTLRPPQDDSARRRTRVSIGAWALVFIGLTVWGTARSEKQASRLPQQVADYINNTTAAPSWFASSLPRPTPPAPPTGLIAVVDGDWGSTADAIADGIFDFLRAEGEPPARYPQETDMDFIVRSNAWYSNVMDQYRKQLAPQACTMVGLLIENGALDKRVGELAKDPLNISGIRILARQIRDSAAVYRKNNKKKN